MMNMKGNVMKFNQLTEFALKNIKLTISFKKWYFKTHKSMSLLPLLFGYNRENKFNKKYVIQLAKYSNIYIKHKIHNLEIDLSKSETRPYLFEYEAILYKNYFNLYAHACF